MAKTIGEMMVEALNSKDPKKTSEAMRQFWGKAKEAGMPTPDDTPIPERKKPRTPEGAGA